MPIIENELTQAVREGDDATIERLIKGGEKLPRRQLYGALSNKRIGTARLLWRLAHKQIAAWEYNASVFPLVQMSSLDGLKFVFELGAPVDARHELTQGTALMLAAEMGSCDMVDLLSKAGADVNLQDVSMVSSMRGRAEGESALMKAVAKGHLEVVKRLLKAGARVNDVGESGKRALDFAVKSANGEAIRKVLIRAGAKSRKDQNNTTKKSATVKGKSNVGNGEAPVTTLAEARRLLESRCGSKARAYPGIKGVWFCHFQPGGAKKQLAGKAYVKALEKLRAELASQGSQAKYQMVRSYEPSIGVGLCVLEANDKFEVVKKFGFSGRKWGVSNQAAIKFLKALDEKAPFELVQCGSDIMSGRFVKGVKKASSLAKELQGFCPFVAMDFDDDLKKLAAHLEKGGEFTLWWD